MYDRILLPTDGSAVADAATDAAVAFARRFDADLHVVHVLEDGDLPPGYEGEPADEFAVRGTNAVQSAAEQAGEVGIDVHTAVLEERDPVHQPILGYADRTDVDCIVMGTYGRTGLDRFLLGSVTERTVRESPIPVLTVHEETIVDPDLESVLVPTDGSVWAEAAAGHAIDLARETGAALHVVTVVDVGVMLDGVDTATVLGALEKAGEQALETVIEMAEDAGLPSIEAAVLDGGPAGAITQYADENDVGCTVMGTHGRTGLDRVLLGSVTEGVIRRTDRPVIAIGSPNSEE